MLQILFRCIPGQPTPLIGREAELAALQKIFGEFDHAQRCYEEAISAGLFS